ncbi:Membrane-bound lytic murein transglycosylase A precursor [Phocoenobacter uteri]|uniref:peptidoglycan lytic exotransglycosylase n=1 Tax=Phocoenobacter uteri TaxID=146806 RepID=A0A379C937_9PAST|nr:murein transglycosylase A [Phocoenobacter uteri]MDG6882516.1 murein transglycosylase A [Phocoenobacter uteri]SUB58679.1 Membrane-bound lytic murein transglycosylase A precursor [Phocoenobacter uteri]
MALIKYTKLSLLTTLVLSVVACSSNSSHNSKLNYSDKEKFGAKYKEHQYYPYAPYVPVKKIPSQKKIVNPNDFLYQLGNVQQYSDTLTKDYAHTYNKLANWVRSGAKIQNLSSYGVNIQQMTGEEGFKNVLMTGYYSPVVNARHTKIGQFQHPIYAMPRNKHFTREQIYNGALAGKGLELAYSDSMLDNFLLGVQGSGYIDFGNGNLNYFAYAGQNGFKYVSIGRLLVEDGEIPKEKMSIKAIREWGESHPNKVQGLLERNPSYVFFKNDYSGKVKGSAGVPLIALASVASDRNIVPSGTPLLVETPVVDEDGDWTGEHEMRLMVALDVGGAVKGQHFDIYQGIGKKAGRKAGLMKHYGRVWLLK